MLTADVRFEGFTQADWARVLSLFRPRARSGERDPERPRGGVVAVHEAGRLHKLVHTEVGRLRLDDCAPGWPLRPEEIAVRHHASWALSLEAGALEDVMEKFGARVRRGDDLTAQSLLLVSLVRDAMLRGTIDFWPARLSGLPVPTATMIDRTLSAVCPRGSSMVIGLFDAGELWTSVAMRRSASGGFDWVLGPDELRRDIGLLAGDWRRDFRHLARAIDKKLGHVSLGVFSDASTFQKLEIDPTPGAWARAVAVRDVILSPVPAALAIPLGIDAGRAAVSAVFTVAERAQGLGLVSPLLGAVKDALEVVAAPREKGGLGFEPLEILRRLITRDS
ncbi:MAG TPA: hypothetical protein VL400_22830 [Polyangiaceae bacterium]|jgi:hypothetical protein|nr:hypothetical protein [Polyangiaceae bacterium]